MPKSPLAAAAFDGDVKRLRALLAKGAPLDGRDGDVYRGNAPGCVDGAPLAVPLGEAAWGGKPEAVRALLAAGAAVDQPNYRNETALVLAAARAEGAACVPLLLAAGADVNHVSGLGTALARLQPEPYAAGVAKQLLAAGARVDRSDSTGASVLDRLVPGTDHAITAADAPALELLRVLVFELRGANRRRVEAAIAAISRAQVEAARKADARSVSVAGLAAPAAVAAKDWPAKIRAQLVDLRTPRRRDTVRLLCTKVLSTARAVAHPAWPALLREVVALSTSYGDATREHYGKRLPLSALDADEGGVMEHIADEHLYTWDWVLTALAAPAPRAHPQWAALVEHVCRAKAAAVSYYSFGDDELGALLTAPASRKHARFTALVAAARTAFPFARVFGTGGALAKTRSKPVAKAKSAKSKSAKQSRSKR